MFPKASLLQRKGCCIHGNQPFIRGDWACVNPTARPILPAASVHTLSVTERAAARGHVHTPNRLLWWLEMMLSPPTRVSCMSLGLCARACRPWGPSFLIPGWVEAGEEVKDGCSDRAKRVSCMFRLWGRPKQKRALLRSFNLL